MTQYTLVNNIEFVLLMICWWNERLIVKIMTNYDSYFGERGLLKKGWMGKVALIGILYVQAVLNAIHK